VQVIPVLFVPFAGPRTSGVRQGVRWKREAIWRNAGRNEVIAGAAEMVARRPRKFLRKHGATSHAIRWPDRVRQRVVLLVEVTEHAEWLERLLPAWEFRHAIPTDREPDDAEEDGDEPTPRGVIATLVYAARYGVRCDVLLRATGGTGRLDWGGITGLGGRGTRPTLVVDVMDTFDERARADAETRRLEYQQQGLRVLHSEGVNATT
jgi:hypothetical protein